MLCNYHIKMSFIQYGKQVIEDQDIDAVLAVLKENQYLTTGPRVQEFEQKMCLFVGCNYAIAVNSGTSALHCCVRACGIGKGDEVIVNAISFVASANAVVYEGGVPVFCDICEDTMNLDLDKLESLITEKTKAIIFVDYAGQANDYHRLRKIADQHNLKLIEDAAHSVGLRVPESVCPRMPMVGSYADLTALSFHPVKNMTTAEGGMILTNNLEMDGICRRFRAHGIDNDYTKRHLHYYDMVELGYNYRITDLQCALGLAQLDRLSQWINRRQEIAEIYDTAFKNYGHLFYPLNNKLGCAYHIYVIILNLNNLNVDRDHIFNELRENNIGVNVHYKPIYLNTFYLNMSENKYYKGLCPSAEKIWSRIITLPIHPGLSNEDINRVIYNVKNIITKYQKVKIIQYTKTKKFITENYCSWLNDPSVTKYLETKSSTMSQLSQFVHSVINDKYCLMYAILYNDTHVGNIKFQPIDWINNEAEIGIIIGDKNYWGKGIATQAFKIGMNLLKEKGIRTFKLGVIKDNFPALNLYKKLGFKITQDLSTRNIFRMEYNT